MKQTQPSRLLPALFESHDDDFALTVLNLGPALPETLEFFSDRRCKLHFADLYTELPLEPDDDSGRTLDALMESALELPGGELFDVCLFWDLLNFLSRDAIATLASKLRPHLHPQSRGHCFAVHSLKTPAATEYYGIADSHHLSVRSRPDIPPGYQPHPQAELISRLKYFQVDRSVLMPDRRLELLLQARL